MRDAPLDFPDLAVELPLLPQLSSIFSRRALAPGDDPEAVRCVGFPEAYIAVI